MSKRDRHSAALSSPVTRGNILQRKCGCGARTIGGGECEECRKKKTLQPKLQVGASDDAYEREADRVADQVVSSSSATSAPSDAPLQVSRLAPRGESASASAPASVDRTLASSGQALDAGVRSHMEQRFGHDFSGVRVHVDSQAQESARDVNAYAYTVGEHVVFNRGHFSPDTAAGRRLLAHELTHVVQQRGDLQARTIQRDGPVEVNAFTPPAECEGETDITKDIQALFKDVDALLNANPAIAADQRQELKGWFNEFFRAEAGVNTKAFSFSSCDKINLTLVGVENAGAFFDGKKKIALSKTNAELIASFRRDKKPEDLSRLLQLLLHEKRHATLGRALRVSEGGLKPGRSLSAAENAEYRAQEILTTAEEIAVARKTLGPTYEVDTGVQLKFYRSRNMIRGWVTDAEYQRLRGIIIAKLRERYGFQDGCDTAITLGVLTSMEKNRWVECNVATGELLTPLPDGLKVCNDPKHAFCKRQLEGAQPQ
jgi:Domain of unknown function (DUF4157)